MAIRLAMVPDGVNSPASFPNAAAACSSSARTVRSSPNTSSPTTASAMACRMAGVGRVTVSLRKSETFGCGSVDAMADPFPAGRLDTSPRAASATA